MLNKKKILCRIYCKKLQNRWNKSFWEEKEEFLVSVTVIRYLGRTVIRMIWNAQLKESGQKKKVDMQIFSISWQWSCRKASDHPWIGWRRKSKKGPRTPWDWKKGQNSSQNRQSRAMQVAEQSTRLSCIRKTRKARILRKKWPLLGAKDWGEKRR